MCRRQKRQPDICKKKKLKTHTFEEKLLTELLVVLEKGKTSEEKWYHEVERKQMILPAISSYFN